jgi:hydrogenase nickel incorporation protein HypA/HybF
MPVHELAICQSVLNQALAIAASHEAAGVGRITVRIGRLAGVEPDLLRRAFPLVAAGTPCEGAVLDIEDSPVTVCCHQCGATSGVPPNRLLCGGCGEWCVSVVSGEELLLASVELLTRERFPAHV